ncbi:YczE/YyaS/YitT family protein [Micromonospora sp. CA-263727]|uniref:membrane protein YczE n=1 Tax=Micromonospora sp. CA-263727 TaxID=3239967 RepID=UPI003D8EFF83
MAMIGNLRHRPARRLAQLFVGLALYGVSMALMIRSGLGLNPWDVFHQGLSQRTGLSMGTAVIVVGALVLLAWIPLRQRPGLGTVANVVVIGLAVDATLALLPPGGPLTARIALLVGGIVGNGAATALYLGARLGPGPRDGLMTGFVARRPGRSLRLVRTVIEIAVLALGALLGGTVGIGTIAYALAIGPLAQLFLPLFDVPEPAGPAPERFEATPAN